MSRARPEPRGAEKGAAGRGDEAEEGGESRGRSVLRELQTLGIAIALALVIRAFLFQSFYVPSDSMFPTLLIGDHVFVNKLVYGPPVPFSDARLPGLRGPERGEVAVFQLARGPPSRRRASPACATPSGGRWSSSGWRAARGASIRPTTGRSSGRRPS